MSAKVLKKKQPSSFYKYTSMATKMMAIILVFTFSGKYSDQLTDLDFPAFTLIGALLGSFLAIYSMIRDLNKW